jgi:hypothetical protein
VSITLLGIMDTTSAVPHRSVQTLLAFLRSVDIRDEDLPSDRLDSAWEDIRDKFEPRLTTREMNAFKNYYLSSSPRQGICDRIVLYDTVYIE